ncbi:CHAT domain-containing protein [Nocardia sp. NPDC059240]|uniref:CHAT domain-containing protein n=1 Tax=Nocardia sp. NPDC059240 TaxID=3346786 RepID=UPI0036BD5842
MDRDDAPQHIDRRALQAKLALVVARAMTVEGAAADVLESDLLVAARSLGATLLPEDGDSRFLLGAFHWYRYLAVPSSLQRGELSIAVSMLVPVFLGRARLEMIGENLLPTLADNLSPTAFGLLEQMSVSSDHDFADVVVRLWQGIVAVTPADDVNHVVRLSNLGAALRVRFERAGALADLDEAVRVGRRAVEAPSDHPNRGACLANLAGTFGTRFTRTGVMADLDSAIDYGRKAVGTAEPGDPDLAGWLSNLGVFLEIRFERIGMSADIDEAVQMARSALEITSMADPNRGGRLSSLGNALRIRFEYSDSLDDLDESIRAHEEAVAAGPPDGPYRGLRLSNLASAHRARFERQGRLDDLDESIELNRAAAVAMADENPDRPRVLSNLGNALRIRFQHNGIQQDLEEAVRVGRSAVEVTPADHAALRSRLSNLGSVLRIRFQHLGTLTDLNESIRAARDVVALTPPDHADLRRYLSNLGNMLLIRYERTDAVEDLDESIELGRHALGLTPLHHPDQPGMRSSLAGVLETRFGRAGELADLDEAVDLRRSTVEASEPGHADRAHYLSHLGDALRQRFEKTGLAADLDESIRLGRAAVEMTGIDEASRGSRLLALGVALRALCDVTGRPADLAEAGTALEQAATATQARPSVRMVAARIGADLFASSQPNRAARLIETAVGLLAQVAPRQLQRSDQQFALARHAGLAADAAALALADPETPQHERALRAVQLMEAGRGVLLSQALQVRSDLTDLAKVQPDLASSFIRLRERLDQPAELWLDEHPVDARQTLVAEFEELLARIRAHDGFASFALPPKSQELVAQAQQGPIVVFNISSHRSDAILLTAEQITSVALPGLQLTTVIDRISAFRTALDSAQTSTSWVARAAGEAELSRTLEWLWDHATGPVLNALGYHQRIAPDRAAPRVWWITGGLLSLLPMHAAGYHHTRVDPDARTVIDRVTSSYTPTIAALRHARRRDFGTGSGVEGGSLIVAMPTTPGISAHLRYALDEARLVAGRLPDTVTLVEAEAGTSTAASGPLTTPTRANVLALLETRSIAHFVCHGRSDAEDPSRSGLLLHDHTSIPFTVAALTPLDLDHARLAYLSACETGLSTAVRLLDEAIHLGSAFQLAGYPHVICTLWRVNDRVALDVSDVFYRELTSAANPDPARALHHAVRAVRDAYLPRPSLWAAHLHTGA